MQEQIAIDSLDRAQARDMTFGAANGVEDSAAPRDAQLGLGIIRNFLDRTRQGGDEGGYLSAVWGSKIQAPRLVVPVCQRGGLDLARIAQAQLVCSSRLDESEQAVALRLPAELADAAIRQQHGPTHGYGCPAAIGFAPP